MKKLWTVFLTLSAAVVVFTVVPWLVRILTAKPEHSPFTLYSCVLHDFTALYQDDDSREYQFHDRNGNVYGDEVQPLFYASILASKGQLPDSLEGRKVTLEEIERNNMFLTSDPRDINKTLPKVFLLMESTPLRLELQEPEDAFISRQDGLYIYNMGTNTLLEEKTEKLNKDLRDLGFVFPAKCIDGNPTDRKDHDEGYLLTDSQDHLFRIKQIDGEIKADYYPQADSLHLKNLKITEFENHATLGMLVTGAGYLAVLEENGDVTVTDVPLCPEKQRILIIGDMFYYTIEASTSEGELFYAVKSDNFELVDTLSRTYEKHFEFPGISFTSHTHSWVKPNF